MAFVALLTLSAWSLEVYWLGRSVTNPDEPVLYFLDVPSDGTSDGPERGFVREELLVVPPDTRNSHRMGFL